VLSNKDVQLIIRFSDTKTYRIEESLKNYNKERELQLRGEAHLLEYKSVFNVIGGVNKYIKNITPTSDIKPSFTLNHKKLNEDILRGFVQDFNPLNRNRYINTTAPVNENDSKARYSFEIDCIALAEDVVEDAIKKLSGVSKSENIELEFQVFGDGFPKSDKLYIGNPKYNDMFSIEIKYISAVLDLIVRNLKKDYPNLKANLTLLACHSATNHEITSPVAIPETSGNLNMFHINYSDLSQNKTVPMVDPLGNNTNFTTQDFENSTLYRLMSGVKIENFCNFQAPNAAIYDDNGLIPKIFMLRKDTQKGCGLVNIKTTSSKEDQPSQSIR
jgi:hypothetical protein